MEQSQRTEIKKAASSLVLLGLMLALLLAAAAQAFAQETPENQSPEPPGPPPSVEQTDLVAQLTVKCPENIEAFYTLVTTGVESRTEVVLTDEDGDGVYTGTQTFPKFPPGPLPVPPSLEPITVPDVRIVAPDGSTVKDFGPVKLDQDEIILPATISLCEDSGGSEQPQCLLPEGCPGNPGPGERFTGTAESEAIYGTYGSDFIGGAGGDDLLVGEAGGDRILGGPGNDFLVAAYAYFQTAPNAPASPDFVQGGPGDDLIDSADLAGAPDTVECGLGSDLVYAGVEDNVAADCEFVYRYEGF